MQEEDIEHSFAELQGLHESFTVDNPITYSIFLAENRHRLNDMQKEFLLTRAKEAIEKHARITAKILEKMDNEISRLPITEKIGEPYSIDLNQKDDDRIDPRETNNQSEQSLCEQKELNI